MYLLMVNGMPIFRFMIKCKKNRKTRLPYYRSYFEKCIFSNNISIAGGMGTDRILQENSFHYYYKKIRIRAML